MVKVLMNTLQTLLKLEPNLIVKKCLVHHELPLKRENMTHPNPTHDLPNHWSLQQKRKLKNRQNQILPTNERVTYTSKLLHYQKGLNYVALNVPHVIIELGVKRNETNITKQFMVY